MVISGKSEPAAPGAFPHAEASGKMMEYQTSLQRAGVLLALDGLVPPSAGSRISFSNGKATVTDGPCAAAAEAIAGYWIIQARSREEAVEWARRAPMCDHEIIEVRQIREIRSAAPRE
jgi:hypothetical protein